MSQKYVLIRHTDCKPPAGTKSTAYTGQRSVLFKKRGPPVSPCEAVVADISGTFVGHTARQRLGEVHQLAPLDPGCRPQTVTLSRTDKTLQLRCHSRLFLPPREPGSVYIRQQTRCVMTSQARTHVNEWTIFPSTVSFPC